jgi:hypothetical protein
MAVFIRGKHGGNYPGGSVHVSRPGGHPQGTVLVEYCLPKEADGFPAQLYLQRDEALRLITDLATNLCGDSANQH